MGKLDNYNKKVFDDIKHVDSNGNEYWFARELQIVLEYREWRKFGGVIDKAKEACINSGYEVLEQFVEADKLIMIAKGAKRKVKDYKLSRYACYLIVQNADPRKEVVALGQTYFAIQTRIQELNELEYDKLTDDEKRLYQRNRTKKSNYLLNKTAKNSGVKHFDKFHNSGYKGLYNGETADDIAKRKGLRYREDILDNMGEEELVDNLFRIIHTERKLKRDNIKNEHEANQTHYKMGRDIRAFIKSQGGTMPEDLPTPQKSIKQIEKEIKSKLIDNK